jgi:hypothetical protein
MLNADFDRLPSGLSLSSSLSPIAEGRVEDSRAAWTSVPLLERFGGGAAPTTGQSRAAARISAEPARPGGLGRISDRMEAILNPRKSARVRSIWMGRSRVWSGAKPRIFLRGWSPGPALRSAPGWGDRHTSSRKNMPNVALHASKNATFENCAISTAKVYACDKKWGAPNVANVAKCRTFLDVAKCDIFWTDFWLLPGSCPLCWKTRKRDVWGHYGTLWDMERGEASDASGTKRSPRRRQLFAQTRFVLQGR